MKTRLSWQTAGANARTLKMDEIGRVPNTGEFVVIRGERYHVLGLESAVVVVEPAADNGAPTSINERNARVAQRLADERTIEKKVVQREHPMQAKMKEPAKVVSHKKK